MLSDNYIGSPALSMTASCVSRRPSHTGSSLRREGVLDAHRVRLVPKVALFSNILLMVIVLLWRPQGIYPVAKR